MEKKIVLILSAMVLVLIALALILTLNSVDSKKNFQEKESIPSTNQPVIVEKEPPKEIGELQFSDCNCNYCIR
jgi:flagellar basal body-associated protein FliL